VTITACDLITHAVAAMVAKDRTIRYLVSAMLTSHNYSILALVKLRLISNYKGTTLDNTKVYFAQKNAKAGNHLFALLAL
jgi:hypothetical protein